MRPIFFFLIISFPFLGRAQHQDKVDFIWGKVFIEPIPKEKSIRGSVTYEFEVLKDVDSIFLDAKNIEFSSVLLNRKNVEYHNDEKTISIKKKLKKGKSYQLNLKYSCQPKQTVYFMGWDDDVEDNEQIWTQGQGKYTSHWLPSFDAMEEKVEFDLIIFSPPNYAVISNGFGTDYPMNKLRRSLDDPKKMQWKRTYFDMQKPMSSYLLAFAIGNYEKQELKSKSGILIENYYYPQDSVKVEPTYRYTKAIFDFLEEEIGFPYPWQNYKNIPVHDFLYAGMENTTATIFSDQYVIDSVAFVDKNYVNVNAHELAHQWFGNLVTEKNSEHHWLHEGFATYYAYLAEQHLFGDDHFYWKLFKTLDQLKDQVENDNGQSLLDPKASSLTFYEKGAWALFALQNEVGEQAFKNGVKYYLNKFQFKNATVSDFLTEMELASELDLSAFREQWLENEMFPYQKAKELLAKKSESVKLAFELEKDLVTFQKFAVNYNKYWNATKSVHLKKYVLEQGKNALPQEILETAIAHDSIPVRQRLLTVVDDIKILPAEKVEALLNDKSYLTIENALLRLWQTYPEKRAIYLDQTKNVIGLPNKNVRLLWLTLAMLTENYNGPMTKRYFDELSAYTDDKFSFEIRQSAFFYLKEVFGLNDESLTNLIKGTNHHSWQFKKFARNLLEKLLQDPEYKLRLQELATKLKLEEIRYLNSKLKIE
jgi:aminopeptidase N